MISLKTLSTVGSSTETEGRSEPFELARCSAKRLPLFMLGSFLLGSTASSEGRFVSCEGTKQLTFSVKTEAQLPSTQHRSGRPSASWLAMPATQRSRWEPGG